MVDPSRYLAFLAASAVVLAIPGPTILLVVTRALNFGSSVRRATVAGVVLGDLVAMSAAMVGLGALLLASSQLFLALRIVGGAYLVWLGVSLIRSRGSQWRLGEGGGSGVGLGDGGLGDGSVADGVPRRVFAEAFAVTATNPKSIAFFVAFVPQFIDPALVWSTQAAAMIAGFVALGGLNAAAYAWTAGRVRQRLQDARIRRRVSAVSGGALVAGGAAVIATG